MSFTLLSISIFLIVITAVAIGVVRGMRRGLVRSSLSLATVFISVIISGLLALLISDIPTGYIVDIFLKSTGLVDSYSDMLPSIELLVQIAVDSLLTPFVFIVLYPIIYGLLCPAGGIVSRCVLKKKPNASFTSPHPLGSPSYERTDAPLHRRYDRPFGGIVGGLCGFLAAIIMLSPIVGTVSMVSSLNHTFEEGTSDWSTIGIDPDFMEEFVPLLDDSAIGVLNATGAGFIYDATATSRLPNGKYISLTHEVNAVSDLLPELFTLIENISDERMPRSEELDRIVDKLEEAYVLRMIVADIINSATSAWLRGEEFMSVSRPVCGNYFDRFITELLKVCAVSDADCVGNDLRTLFNIYGILQDNGIMDLQLDEQQFRKLLMEGSFIQDIKHELESNPCMAGLVDKLSDTSLEIFSSFFDGADLSSKDAQQLMQEICDSYNQINGSGGNFDDRVEQMTDAVGSYMDRYGIELPPEVTEMAISALIKEIGEVGSLEPDDLEAILRQYSSHTNLPNYNIPTNFPDETQGAYDY